MLYLAYQLQSDVMAPVRSWASAAASSGTAPLIADHPALRNLTAVYELIARAGLTHMRPPFGIDSVTIDGREVEVHEKAAARTPFATLLHFSKEIAAAQPRVLLVAPLSGHFSTTRNRAYYAPGARCFCHRLAQRTRHPAHRRPLRRRRIYRSPDQVLGSDRAARAHPRGLPALRRGDGGGRRNGSSRQSDAAALDDVDGGPNRRQDNSDQGQ